MDLIDLLRTRQCKVKYDEEYNDKWTDKELLFHIIGLDCSDQRLTSLPELPQCQKLWCKNNQLTSLPELPQCQYLSCQNNQLLFNQLNEFKKIWAAKKLYHQIKYSRLIYKKMLLIRARQKEFLHLEKLINIAKRYLLILTNVNFMLRM